MSILGEMNLKTLFTVLYRLSISLVFSHADYFLGPAKRAARPQQVTHGVTQPSNTVYLPSAGLKDKNQKLDGQIHHTP